MNTLQRIGLLTALLFTAGCDVLEQRPQSLISSQTFFQTSEHAEAGIRAVYAAMRNGLNGFIANCRIMAWGDLRADFLASDPGRVSGYDRADLNQQNAQEQIADWSDLYLVIGRANDVLQKVPAITDARLTEKRKNEIVGEAKFMRALAYFYLVRLWGDVPLILTPPVITDGRIEIPRSPRNTVLDQIETDLREALTVLPNSFNQESETRGRATVGGGLALQAHVFAWRGKWAEAETTTRQLLQSSLYTLVANYADIFDVENTRESILELQLLDANTNEPPTTFYSEFLPNAANGGFGNNLANMIPTAKFISGFEPGDLRKAATVYDGNGVFRPHIVKYTLPYRKADLGKSVTPRNANADNNLIIFRLADLILLRAETLNNLERPDEAITLLNRVRSRAGLPPTKAVSKAELKTAILKERGYELAFEGHRWFDLVRNGEAQREIPSLTDPNRLLLPILEREIVLNRGITANNPGY